MPTFFVVKPIHQMLAHFLLDEAAPGSSGIRSVPNSAQSPECALATPSMPVAELIRKAGISKQTFYRWKKQYVGLESDQVREMKQLQDENRRLKQPVADLRLDKTMLQDCAAK
jgi:putative transposase